MDDGIFRPNLCIRRIPRAFTDEPECYIRGKTVSAGKTTASMSVDLHMPMDDDPELIKIIKLAVRNEVNEQRMRTHSQVQMSMKQALNMCESMMIQAMLRGYAMRIEHEKLN